MKISPFYLFEFKSLEACFFSQKGISMANIFETLDVIPTGQAKTVCVRLTMDVTGESARVINLEKGQKNTAIGSDTISYSGCISFIASMTYTDKRICLHTLERDAQTSKLITLNTFAETFRIRSDFYPLTDGIIRDKLKNFQGVGVGTATINIATQELANVVLFHDQPMDKADVGTITKFSDQYITVSCCFANGGVNTLTVIE